MVNINLCPARRQNICVSLVSKYTVPPLDSDTPPTSIRLTPRMRSADLHLLFNMHVCVSPSCRACLSPLAAMAEPTPPHHLGQLYYCLADGTRIRCGRVSDGRGKAAEKHLVLVRLELQIAANSRPHLLARWLYH